MTKLLWDQVGAKPYETGLDHGVLFLANGTAIPWNGLTSLEETFSGDSNPSYYFDGVKYLDVGTIGDFTGTLSAFTYPDEFLEYEGIVSLNSKTYSDGVVPAFTYPDTIVSTDTPTVVQGGVFIDNQPVQTFNLVYRTSVYDDLGNFSYKLHLLYGLMVTPADASHDSVAGNTSPLEFSWGLASVPQALSGFRPTAHAIIDSRYTSAYLLAYLEAMLFGSDTASAHLPSLAELVPFVQNYHYVTIVDNGDGTWTATVPDTMLTMLDANTFQLSKIAATYLDSNTYTVSTSEAPQEA